MKSVLALFCYFLFWQRILRWTFAAGVLLSLAGALWYMLAEPEPLQGLLVLLGAVLMWLFPVLLSGAMFRQLISNSRMALLPQLRLKAGLALLVLTLLASSWLTAALGLTKHGLQGSAFAISFCAGSAFLLLGQWWLSQRWGAALYWLFIVACSQIWQLPIIRNGMQQPNTVPVLLTIAIAGWLALFYWLVRARGIRRLQMTFNQFTEKDGVTQMGVPPLLMRLSVAGTRSPINTLLLGGYYNLVNRIGLQIFLYAAFPLTMVLISILPALGKGKPLPSVMANPDALLAMGLYGGFVAGFFGREWLARARYLWLRSPGDRAGLWTRLETLTRTDLAVSVGVSTGYAGGVWLLTEVAVEHALWFVLLNCSCMLFYTYLSQFLRLRQFGIAVHLVLAGVSLALVVAALAMVYLHTIIWPVAVLVSLFLATSLLLRQRARLRFLQIDWCQIRPMLFTADRRGCDAS